MCCGKKIIYKKTGVEVNSGLKVFIKYLGKIRKYYVCPSGKNYYFTPQQIIELPINDAEYLLTLKYFEVYNV